jgi:hypothetical protein
MSFSHIRRNRGGGLQIMECANGFSVRFLDKRRLDRSGKLLFRCPEVVDRFLSRLPCHVGVARIALLDGAVQAFHRLV